MFTVLVFQAEPDTSSAETLAKNNVSACVRAHMRECVRASVPCVPCRVVSCRVVPCRAVHACVRAWELKANPDMCAGMSINQQVQVERSADSPEKLVIVPY